MTRLGDKFRELQSICEGEIQKRETILITLRHEVERLRKELVEAKDQQLAVRHPKCEHCAYRIIALKSLKSLESEEKAKK